MQQVNLLERFASVTTNNKSGRFEFLLVLFGGGLVWGLAAAGLQNSKLSGIAQFAFLAPLWLLIFWLFICGACRRFRDLGEPAGNVLSMLVPIYNLFVFFRLLLKPGR